MAVSPLVVDYFHDVLLGEQNLHLISKYLGNVRMGDLHLLSDSDILHSVREPYDIIPMKLFTMKHLSSYLDKRDPFCMPIPEKNLTSPKDIQPHDNIWDLKGMVLPQKLKALPVEKRTQLIPIETLPELALGLEEDVHVIDLSRSSLLDDDLPSIAATVARLVRCQVVRLSGNRFHGHGNKEADEAVMYEHHS